MSGLIKSLDVVSSVLIARGWSLACFVAGYSKTLGFDLTESDTVSPIFLSDSTSLHHVFTTRPQPAPLRHFNDDLEISSIANAHGVYMIQSSKTIAL